MRYHYEKPGFYTSQYVEVYICDHPVYNRCTLYKIGEKGLAVIQQRVDVATKTTWWGELDPWLTDAIYLHAGFYTYFEKRAKPASGGLFPTVTVRQLMWAIKIKPLVKERLETVFDRREIYNSSYEEVDRYGNDSDADSMVRGLNGTIHRDQRSSFVLVDHAHLWREVL